MSDRPEGFDCRCWDMGLRPGMSYDELYSFLRDTNTCCDQWICGNFDRQMRRAEKEKRIRDRYHKKLKREGYTDEQIRNRAPRSRTVKTYDKVEL